ncbi:hypothetical protein OPQ81_008068 [Rhizoctonia solani]|nr:hypothetical protein OPQ81_008068 [Rhizoctonia solani]
MVAGHCTSPQQDAAKDTRRTPSPIYVSSRDPLGEPTFRRSPTKPIPKWMQYLPSYRQDNPAYSEHTGSVLDNLLSKPNAKSFSSDTDEQDSSPPPVPPHIVPVRPNSLTYTPTQTPVQKSRPFTLIAEEPVQRPSYTRLEAGQSKRVRFDSNPRGPLSSVSFLRNRAQSPSESAEYLERYEISTPSGVKSSAVPIHSPTREANEHHAKVVCPSLKRVDTHPLSSSISLKSSRLSADENHDEYRSAFSPIPQHRALEGLSAAQKSSLGHSWSHDRTDKGHGGHLGRKKSFFEQRAYRCRWGRGEFTEEAIDVSGPVEEGFWVLLTAELSFIFLVKQSYLNIIKDASTLGKKSTPLSFVPSCEVMSSFLLSLFLFLST